ncbi:hypothetical protein [Bacillus sp. FJAT-44742]|uniref:hypothetical protein n=1 Tax=Bacillus sp. FJAT-44742 TaxID=2014005 RepID=UPI000C244268|nr:hypothetical protein [Bacillus sp. FJAT-44742]
MKRYGLSIVTLSVVGLFVACGEKSVETGTEEIRAEETENIEGEETATNPTEGVVAVEEVEEVEPGVEEQTEETPQYEQFVSDYNSFISMYFDSEALLNVEDIVPHSDYDLQMNGYVTHSIKVSEKGNVIEVTLLGKTNDSQEGSRELPVALAGTMHAMDQDHFESVEEIDAFLTNETEFDKYTSEGEKRIKAETDSVEYSFIDLNDSMLITVKPK